MMSNIDQVATLKALERVRISGNRGMLDYVLDGTVQGHLSLKRVQFETWPDLSDELEKTCVNLRVSKREFLESALVDALDRTNRVFREVARECGAEVSPETFSLHFPELEQIEPQHEEQPAC